MRINEIFAYVEEGAFMRDSMLEAVRRVLASRRKMGIDNSVTAFYDERRRLCEELEMDHDVVDRIFDIPRVRQELVQNGYDDIDDKDDDKDEEGEGDGEGDDEEEEDEEEARYDDLLSAVSSDIRRVKCMVFFNTLLLLLLLVGTAAVIAVHASTKKTSHWSSYAATQTTLLLTAIDARCRTLATSFYDAVTTMMMTRGGGASAASRDEL
jgi:hypothetical protein